MAKEIGDGRAPEDVADGFIKIAVENMANAIKKISVQRGYDVTRYALNCFGGAGGQHACLVADALGMTSVLIHPLSSLLSAYGMGLADIRSVRQQAIEETFGPKARKSLETVATRLAADTRDEVTGQGVAADKIKVHVRAHIRYAGTDTALIVEAGTAAGRGKIKFASLEKMKAAFERAHKAQFGFIDRRKELVIEAVSVEAVGGGATFSEKPRKTTRAKLPAPARRTRFYSGGKWHRALVYTRDTLSPGHKVKGPPSSSSRTRPSSSNTAGRPSSRPRTISCSSACRSSRASARSAPMPIRSCSKCSTTSSCRSPSRWAWRCRTPPIRSTSRSGSTSPARCSTATARWSPMRRTCRCISARWIAPSRPSSARTRARSARATPMRSMRRITAARICPTSPSARRSSTARRSCSGSPRAAITPMSAAFRRARCRRTRPISKRKASCSTTSRSSTAAASARRSSMRR